MVQRRKVTTSQANKGYLCLLEYIRHIAVRPENSVRCMFHEVLKFRATATSPLEVCKLSQKLLANINALLRHEIQFWYPSRYLHAFVHSFPGSRLCIGIFVTPPLFSVQFLRRRRLFIICASLFLSIYSPVVITWFLHQCIPLLYIPRFQRPLSSHSFPVKKGTSSLSSSPLHFLSLMFFLCFILSVFPSVLCRSNVRHVFSFVYFHFIQSLVCVAWGFVLLLWWKSRFSCRMTFIQTVLYPCENWNRDFWA